MLQKQKSLLTIYKVFQRTLIDYRYIIYDQPPNSYFCEKLQSGQYKAILVLGSTISTSSENIFQELGLETLKSRRWFTSLYYMCYVTKNEETDYLISLIPKRILCNLNNIPAVQPHILKASGFPCFYFGYLSIYLLLNMKLQNATVEMDF